jgi:nucleotide sugar dehydrogenase
MNPSKLKEKVLSNEMKIGVWGVGFVGTSVSMYYAHEGIEVIGYDIDQGKIDEMKKGKCGVANLEEWVGFPMAPFIHSGMIKCSSNVRDMYDQSVAVHFVCVPTEKEGDPWFGALENVLGHLKKISPPLAIIESTLTPKWLDKIASYDLSIAVAPRRDWFASPDQNLRNLWRVYCGCNDEVTRDCRDVLSIVCDHLIKASNMKVAALTKCIENSILHLCIGYSNQLSRAYTDVDVDEVLRLASTHWRIGRYYPSFGSGGYCIPTSSRYVLQGANNPGELTLLRETCTTDDTQPLLVADTASQYGNEFAVLGIAYKGDLKVHILSPALPLIRRLIEKGKTVRVHDPYYTPQEINDITGTPTLEFPDDLEGFDGILIVTNHRLYSELPRKVLTQRIKKGTIILDNFGIWKKHKELFGDIGVLYYRLGDKGWLEEDQHKKDG